MLPTQLNQSTNIGTIVMPSAEFNPFDVTAHKYLLNAYNYMTINVDKQKLDVFEKTALNSRWM